MSEQDEIQPVTQSGPIGIIQSLSQALAGRGATALLALIVLYGVYNLADKGIESINSRVDNMTGEIKELNKELGNIRTFLERVMTEQSVNKSTLTDHEARLRNVERSHK